MVTENVCPTFNKRILVDLATSKSVFIQVSLRYEYEYDHKAYVQTMFWCSMLVYCRYTECEVLSSEGPSVCQRRKMNRKPSEIDGVNKNKNKVNIVRSLRLLLSSNTRQKQKLQSLNWWKNKNCSLSPRGLIGPLDTSQILRQHFLVFITSTYLQYTNNIWHLHSLSIDESDGNV